MKKIISICLSLIMLIAMQGMPELITYAAEAAEVPGIIHVPWRLEPAEVGAVYGEGFDESSTVALQPLTGFADEPKPDSAQYKIKPFNINSQYVQFEMPKDMAYDVCAVWVSNKNGWSKMHYTNKPVMYWVNEHDIYSGQKLLLYVRNAVNPTNRSAGGAAVEFVEEQTGSVLKGSIYDINDYQVFFTAPQGLKTGSKYNIRYTNGAGGEYGWSEMENKERETVTAVENNGNTRYFDKNWDLNISWFSEINTSNILNVKDFGAKGDGAANDTAAIQSAVDKAKADGGGIVYIPDGTYILDFVNIGKNTILQGESKDKTILKWSGNTDKNVAQTPRTTINRGAIASGKYAEAAKIVYTDESYVGLFDLSIISDIERPEELRADDITKNRMIYGYVVPVAFLGMAQKWNDDAFPEGEEGYDAEGYVLKNVGINIVDGAVAMIWSNKGVVMEDCDTYVSHSTEVRAPGYTRVRNNTFSNILRPLIMFGGPDDCIWMEGNVLTGRGDVRRMEEGTLERKRWGEMWGTLEHRGTDFGGEDILFVNNDFEGEIGDFYDGSGEGFQSQDGELHLFSRVKDAGENWVTCNDKPDSVKPGDEAVINYGRGMGQLMTVKAVEDEKIIFEKNWEVIPDKTSILQVLKTAQSNVTFYKNTWNCNNNKGSIHLYRSGYNVAIVDNNLPDGGGIRMAAVQRPKGVDFQYFHLVENNFITGSTNIGHSYQGASTAIGSSNDGGIGTWNNTAEDKDLLATPQYGIRILHNDMTGLGTNINDSIFHKTGANLAETRSDVSLYRYSRYNGIVLSTRKPEEEGNTPFRMNVAGIVEGNNVKDCIAGIHSSSDTYDAVIRNNDLTGNGKEISEEGAGNNNMMLASSDGKAVGLIERQEINKSMLKKVSQNVDLSGLDLPGTNGEEDENSDNVFSDIENHWAKQQISYLKSREVIDGVTDNSFEPERQVTRAEFITMLTKACGMSIGEFKGGYYDVYTGDWYAPYMQTAKDKSLIDDNMLQYNKAFPNKALSREEAASVTARAMQSMGLEAENTISLEVYDDLDSISEWARNYISYLYDKKVMRGTDLHKFSPNTILTRAEAAVIIYNLLLNMQ